jgi:hypothetical protein
VKAPVKVPVKLNLEKVKKTKERKTVKNHVKPLIIVKKEERDNTYGIFGLKLLSPSIHSIWIINSHTNNRINSFSFKLFNIILVSRNMFS